MLHHVRLPDCDADLTPFVAGQLGIIRPELFNRFKVVAYRYLIDKPLSVEEQSAFVRYHNQARDMSYEGAESQTETAPPPSPQQVWISARMNAVGTPVDEVSPERYATASEFFFLNCLDDSFHNAARTLDERVKQFGANSRWVKEWVEAQDAVFSNCSQDKLKIPNLPPGDAPEIIKYDRAYQIAAAHFYGMNFDEAIKGFSEIAKDSSSPWHELAPYVRARALLRKASLTPPPAGQQDGDSSTANREIFIEAEKAFTAASTSSSSESLRVSAQGLATRAGISADLPEAFRVLVKRLEEGESNPQDLINFTLLLRRGAEMKQDDPSDLLNWLDVLVPSGFQELAIRQEPEGETSLRLDRALTRYKDKKTLPWLLAVAALIPDDHEQASKIMDALNDVPSESAGYPTALYHRFRLSLKDRTEARKILDAALKSPAITRYPSTLGSFKSLAATLATTFDEFLDNAEVQVTAYDSWCSALQESYSNESGTETRSRELSKWTIGLFNRELPLSRLLEASKSPKLSKELRAELARVAFVRALLLRRDTELLASLKEIRPLGGPADSLIDKIEQATSNDERYRAALFLVMHAPAFRRDLHQLDHLTVDFEARTTSNSNWWCAPGTLPETYYTPIAQLSPASPFPEVPANFLTEEERTQAAAEHEALAKRPGAADMFVAQTIEWSNSVPTDPRVPEALHLAVKAGRWATCEKVSAAAAYKILHSKYSKSSWAKKTPHWFSPE